MTTTACFYCGRPNGHSCDCGEWTACAGKGCNAQVRADAPSAYCDECGTGMFAQLADQLTSWNRRNPRPLGDRRTYENDLREQPAPTDLLDPRI